MTNAQTEWSAGDRRNYQHGELIHEVFRYQARRVPDAIALIDRGREITYRELDAASDSLAKRLEREGLAPGAIVPILMGRSPQLIATILAVLKCGGAYAAFDKQWPRVSLDRLISRVSPPFTLADGDTGSLESVVIRQRPGQTARWGDGVVGGHSPSTVFFTSGSSGEPNAILSPHRATTRLFDRCQFARFDEATVMPQAAPLQWDGYTLELWGPLLNGGTSILVHDRHLLPATLRTLIERHGVTTTVLTMSVFNLFVEEDLGAFGGLRELLIGGERASTAHVRRFILAHPEIGLANGYGPAESCVYASTHRFSPNDAALQGRAPIGRPVPNTQIYVLAADGRLCEAGESGEIAIAGDGLAIGYLTDSLTDLGKFVERDVAGSRCRLYLSGDRGHWDSDGRLFFEGRLDRQIKLRGNRVELADVEQSITAITGISRTVAVPALSDDGERYEALYAFFRSESNESLATLTSEAVREQLEAQLPSYLIPDRIFPCSAFPLTDNGKVDTEALLKIAAGTITASSAGNDETLKGLSGDTVTRAVATTFAEILGVQQVGAEDSFFALGGTSLDLARAAIRISEKLGVPLPITIARTEPTVEAISGWIRRRPVPDAAVVEGLTAGPRSDNTPLFEAQVSFWFASQSGDGDQSSHCSMVWFLDGSLELDRLAAALALVHVRHEALHSRYWQSGRLPVATPDVALPTRFAVLDPAATNAAAHEKLVVALGAPFDITQGHVWHAAVTKSEESDGWFFGLSIHHIAFDGWSEHVLAEDLSNAYNALNCRAPFSPVPAPTLRELHEDVLSVKTMANLQQQRDGITRRLKDLPALNFPAPESPVTATSGELEHALSADLVAAISSHAREWGTTPYAVYLAAYAQSLSALTGQSAFGIGVPVTRRPTGRSQRAVACLLNTLCLPIRYHSSEDSLTIAIRSLAESMTSQDIPFHEVVAAAGVRRGTRNSLYQTMLVLQDNAAANLDLGGVHGTLTRPASHAPPTEILTEIWPEEFGCLVKVTYHASEIRRNTAERLLEQFTTELERMVSSPASDAISRSSPL